MKNDSLKIKIHNQNGEIVGEENLDPAIFGIEVKPELIHEAVVAQMANKRLVLAHTKTKGEVRGGGKKPWRQKGTGRARHGSIRSPLWRGGGVTFGPTKERVFTKKINKKAKKKALFMGLSDKFNEKKIVVLDKLELKEVKTKKMAAVLQKLSLNSKKTLFVFNGKDNNIMRAANNISSLKTIRADSLNVLDVIKYEYILVLKEAIKVIKETYLN